MRASAGSRCTCQLACAVVERVGWLVQHMQLEPRLFPLMHDITASPAGLEGLCEHGDVHRIGCAQAFLCLGQTQQQRVDPRAVREHRDDFARPPAVEQQVGVRAEQVRIVRSDRPRPGERVLRLARPAEAGGDLALHRQRPQPFLGG